MKRSLLIIFMAICMISCIAQESCELAIRYYEPAVTWEETLPLGNGRIGMMPDGGTDIEQIVLNDISMWSGSEDPEAINLESFTYLDEIRQLLLAGENLKAQKLMYTHFRSGGKGSAFGQGKDAPYGCFQMLGNIQIQYTYPKTEKEINYEHVLSLNDAVASTKFTKGGVTYLREYFASHADDVLVTHIVADKKKSVSLEFGLSRPERASVFLKDN